MQFRRFLLLSLVVGALIAIGVLPVVGQNETIITIALPEWTQNTLGDDLFTDFTAQNPGVKVIPIYSQNFGSLTSGEPSEEFINQTYDDLVDNYAVADVHFVNNFNVNLETTRAGLFLDLQPLVSGDPDFDVDDFFPSMWESYQWDRGLWAIPISANPSILVYNAKAFDEAGLAYPDENWTLTDYANAARELATVNEEGEVTAPGLTGFDIRWLFMALLGQSLIDQSVIPNEVAFNTPEMQALLSEWRTLVDEGYIRTFGEFDGNATPMAVGPSWRLSGVFGDQDPEEFDWRGVLLPGGRGGVSPNGFAISSGTSQPELAYALVEYLSKSPSILQIGFSDLPARRSLLGAENESEFAQFFTEPEEVTALKVAALENGIPESHMQLYNFLRSTVESVAVTFEDGSFSPEPTTLEEAQQHAEETLRLIEQWRNNRGSFVVVTPVPTPIINEGQIVLRFRVSSMMSPMPNADLWDNFIVDFIASEPDLGNIDLETGFGGPGGDEGDQPDCFYTPFNQVSSLDLNTLIPLDPFLDSDPDFNASDVLGTTLTQLQRGGQTWAYPISIQPEVIAYNSQYFIDAGLDFPTTDWTIDQMVDLMNQIQQANPEMEHLFRSGSGATTLFMLIAAYGGLPLDYSTNPPTLNLTDPATIQATQQVLDLAKSGLMEYQELEQTSFGSSMSGGIQSAFRATNFNNLAWAITQMNNNSSFMDPTRYTVYPRGVDYTPVSYSIGTGYISATSRSPEICYRLLKAIAARPDLALGMPASRSLVEDPMLDSTVGEPVADLYRRYAEALEQPNAVFIPSAFSFDAGIGGILEQIWIYRAFDNYVLREGDLLADLTEADRLITEYRACVPDVGTIDIFNLSPLEGVELFQQFTDCAEQLDPTLEGRFGL